MGDLIGDGAAWLAGQQRSHVSRSVVYRFRDETELADVPATVGATDRTAEDAGDIKIVAGIRDFIIHASDIVKDGSQVAPQRGDQIKETDSNGTVHTYQVGARSDGDDVWVWADPNHIRRLIYTSLMDST